MNVSDPAAHAATPGVLAARFNPLYRPYLVVTIGLTFAVTFVGIPLAIVWFCGVGQWWSRHYFHKLMCELDGKTLRFRKGILFQVEKTIPLENIQDVTFIEGPVLRKFHLATLKFETAGHSAGQANDMHLTGIIDAHEFRNRILEAREHLRAQMRGGGGVGGMITGSGAAVEAGGAKGNGQVEVLERIAARLDEIAGMLREKP